MVVNQDQKGDVTANQFQSKKRLNLKKLGIVGTFVTFITIVANFTQILEFLGKKPTTQAISPVIVQTSLVETPNTMKGEILKDGDFEAGDLTTYWVSSEPKTISFEGYVSADGAATAGTIEMMSPRTNGMKKTKPTEVFSLDSRFAHKGKCLLINNANRTVPGKPYHLHQEGLQVSPNVTYQVEFYIQGEIKSPDSLWFSFRDLWINEPRFFIHPERFDTWTKKKLFLTVGDQTETKFWILVNDEATNLRIDDITLTPISK